MKQLYELINKLNQARNEYYNNNNLIMSDQEYDKLFDELKQLENEYQIFMSNSPTQSVGYEVKSSLSKVTHKEPLLSLDKTKEVNDLNSFKSNKDSLLMYKLDGLTLELTYENYELRLAETRGNGIIGEDVTHCVRAFSNVPLKINTPRLIRVVGEAIIDYPTFKSINEKLRNQGLEEYKNPRNLVSGTVRQLDSKVCKERNPKFYAFDVREGGEHNSRHWNLVDIGFMGFEVCPHYCIVPKDNDIQEIVDYVKENNKILPIDGLVMIYDDIKFSKVFGATSHHPKYAIAFKYEDESVETILRDILVDVGKSGQVSYTALFDPIEIEGSIVEKASVHNYEYIQGLELGIGDTIHVIKANMIIPQIVDNDTRSGTFEKVTKCPYCNTELIHDGVHQFCPNFGCDRQVLGRLVHFCSRDAMDIRGISEETIKSIREIKIGLKDRPNLILNSFEDFYELHNFKDDLYKLDRFGKKKVDNLLEAIENSKTKPLENVIYALAIPQVGRTASKKIAEYYENMASLLTNGNTFDIRRLTGESVGQSFCKHMHNRNFTDMIDSLHSLGLTMTQPQQAKTSNALDGKTFVVTGEVNHFKNRKELEAKITSLGGKIGSGVSKVTSFLINNDTASNSSKNVKTKELGIPIISEEEFLEMIK